MDERVYWIWLQNAFGAGSPKPRQIVERVGSVAEFHEGGISLWSSFAFISDKELASLNAYGIAEAQAALEYCERLGQRILVPGMDEYPQMLSEIYNPPAVLYVRGALPPLDELISIGVVGTRKASESGLAAAREISYQLALEGAAVISGGALGIDSEAHRGAINGRGRTVAVLPCGLDYPYLMDNAILRREILDRGGALVSEYPMNTPVQRGSFHVRNRLISGMAHGVFVAEAPKKSGALITARFAVEQDREVFAFIGADVDADAFFGCRALVEDGATEVKTANDILKAFATRRKRERLELLERAALRVEKPVPKVRPRRVALADLSAQPPETPAGLSEQAAAVFAALDSKEQRHISALQAQTGLSTAAVQAALTELELFDIVRAYPGQRFTKSE